LSNLDEQPVGVSLMQLTMVSESEMVEQAKYLIERAKQVESRSLSESDIIDVITTIVVYKFANLNRQEVEAMLGVNLEASKVYQEAKAEGKEEGREEGKEELKLQLVARMRSRGMTIEDIAQLLDLTVEQVAKV
jgi:predicted transposase/invertase (TIGR01784 family)